MKKIYIQETVLKKTKNFPFWEKNFPHLLILIII